MGRIARSERIEAVTVCIHDTRATPYKRQLDPQTRVFGPTRRPNRHDSPDLRTSQHPFEQSNVPYVTAKRPNLAAFGLIADNHFPAP